MRHASKFGRLGALPEQHHTQPRKSCIKRFAAYEMVFIPSEVNGGLVTPSIKQ